MTEEQDPQLTPPSEGQGSDGQGGAPVESHQAAPQGQPTDDRYEQLERSYAEARRKIQEQGRKLNELMEQRGQPAEPAPSAETYFTDPIGTTKQVVSSVLSEFEQRQRNERLAERMKTETARRHGIPEDQFDQYFQRLQEASSDPYELMETLARMWKADHADQVAQQAARGAVDAAKRDARAVTAEGGTPASGDPGEIPMSEFRSWPAEKRQAYLARKLGVQEFGA